MKFMTAEGIETRTFFYPLHLQPGLAHLQPHHSAANNVFPGATYAYENGVCLPLYPGMPAEDVEYVCDKIDEFYRK
jgi:perosamine synthetase